MSNEWWGRAQTTLTTCWVFLTTYPPLITTYFSLINADKKSTYFDYLYPPPLINVQNNSKKPEDVENITHVNFQSPTLEAENPFKLVFWKAFHIFDLLNTLWHILTGSSHGLKIRGGGAKSKICPLVEIGLSVYPKKPPRLRQPWLRNCERKHSACISFWIPKWQAISTDNGFIFKKINWN